MEAVETRKTGRDLSDFVGMPLEQVVVRSLRGDDFISFDLHAR